MKDKKEEKNIISILKRVWDDSHKYKNLRVGDLVKDKRKGIIGIIIGFKPDGALGSEGLENAGVNARIKVNFNASETTEGTLLGKSPIAILQTLEQPATDGIFEYLEFRIRYVSEKHLIRLEPDTGRYNEGLTLLKEHCSNECILECSPDCSLYKYQ